jgi:hypothetical protein
MFDIRRVRDTVRKRVAILRNATEEQIHEVWSNAIREELQSALRLAAEVRSKALTPRCHHPEQGWIMVEREQVARADDLLRRFCAAFIP